MSIQMQSLTETAQVSPVQLLLELFEQEISLEQLAEVAGKVFNLQCGFVCALLSRNTELEMVEKIVTLAWCYDVYIPRTYGNKYFVKCYIQICDFFKGENLVIIKKIERLHNCMGGENVNTINKIWKRCHNRKLSSEKQIEKLEQEMVKVNEYERNLNEIYRMQMVEELEAEILDDTDYNDRVAWILEWKASGLTIQEFNTLVEEDKTKTKLIIRFGNEGKPDTTLTESKYNMYLWKFRSYVIIQNVVEGLRTNAMTPNILDAYNECAQEWFNYQMEYCQNQIEIFTENAKILYSAVKRAVEVTDVRKKKNRKKKKKVQSSSSEEEFHSAEDESEEECVLRPKECMFCGTKISCMATYEQCKDCEENGEEIVLKLQ